MTEALRLRRDLTGPLPRASWPAGIGLIPFTADLAPRLHALLAAGYTPGQGIVEAFDRWWGGLIGDSEFDPSLVFIAGSADGEIAGLCQCWTSAFVKDLVVAGTFRRQGIGEALLLTAFEAFKQRGAPRADLKVMTGNLPAIRLYRRNGMVDA